jgi:hypothetical protein
MNKYKIFLIITAFLFISCNNDELKIDKTFLSIGKIPGTFNFKFTGKVNWVLESGFPVELSIVNCKTKEKYGRLVVENEKTVSISVDLKPGCYTIASHLLRNEIKSIYKDYESYQFMIESDGGVLTGDIEIEHKRKFEVEAPSVMNTIDLLKEKPKLKWKAVKDAVYYSIDIEVYGYWGSNKPELITKIGRSRMENHEYDFMIKKPGKKYTECYVFWKLKAFSKTKKLLAEGWSTFMIKFGNILGE